VGEVTIKQIRSQKGAVYIGGETLTVSKIKRGSGWPRRGGKGGKGPGGERCLTLENLWGRGYSNRRPPLNGGKRFQLNYDKIKYIRGGFMHKKNEEGIKRGGGGKLI